MDTNLYENYNSTNTFLHGTYVKKGKTLVNKGLKGLKKILLLDRKNTTKKKTSKYLLDISEGKGKYISSLYSTSTIDIYRIEYLGQEYELDLTSPTKVVITPK